MATFKEICYKIKRGREEAAKENGIEGFDFTECPFADNCKELCDDFHAKGVELSRLIQEKNKVLNKHDEVEINLSIFSNEDIKNVSINDIPEDDGILVLSGKINCTKSSGFDLFGNQKVLKKSKNRKRGLLGVLKKL